MSVTLAPLHEARGPAPAQRHTRPFRSDIEGLRAVAVVLVVLFHAHVPGVGGGYVGVDVFFVISGFLITGLMIDEVDRTGRLSLKRFYARRARRILPAASVVLVVVLAASHWLFSPLRQVDVVKDVIASAFYVSNWRFIQLQTDYMQAGRAESPLLHYWSLAVEEQFYLLWPLVVLVAGVLVTRRGRTVAGTILGLAIFAGGISFAFSLSHTASDPTLAYMGSPTRAWEFAAGAALAALHCRGWAMRSIRGSMLLGWMGMAAILVAALRLTESTPFPGLAALLPVAGTCAVIVAGTVDSSRQPRHALDSAALLSLPPVRFIGRLSFSYYLWHWPVLVFAAAVVSDLSWQQELGLMAITLIPAWICMTVVEDPIRRARIVVTLPRRGLSLGVAAMALPTVLALLIGTQLLSIVGISNEQRAMASPRKDSGDPFAVDQSEGPVTPMPAEARVDYPGYPDQCQATDGQELSAECTLDADGSGFALTSEDRVVLFGDSHAGQWYEAVRSFASSAGLDIEVLIKTGCPVSTVVVADVDVQTKESCDTWRENAISALEEEPRARYIFVSELHHTGATAKNVQDTISRLERVGDRIVYIVDTPFPQRDVPECVSGHLDSWEECSFPRRGSLWPDDYANSASESSSPDIAVVSMNDLLCPGRTSLECPAVRGGILLYRDHSHLTRTAVSAMSNIFTSRVAKAFE